MCRGASPPLLGAADEAEARHGASSGRPHCGSGVHDQAMCEYCEWMCTEIDNSCTMSTWRGVPTNGRSSALRHGRDAGYSTAGADDGPLHPCQSGCSCGGPCSLLASVCRVCTLLHGTHVRSAACWRRAAAADPQVAVWRCMHPCMVSSPQPSSVSEGPATVLRLANALEADGVLLL